MRHHHFRHGLELMARDAQEEAVTNKTLIKKLQTIGKELQDLQLTDKQKKTAAQMEIDQAIVRVGYALMALGVSPHGA